MQTRAYLVLSTLLVPVAIAIAMTPYLHPAAHCKLAAIEACDLIASLLRPKEALNIWQWAERNRIIAKGVSAVSETRDVPYRVSYAPHQKEMQESPLDPAVNITVLMGASQIMGKTEVINNIIGYHVDHTPRSQIIMYPTIESAEKFSKKKLMPMINQTPALAALVRPARARDSASTILVKDFLGGSIFLIGANSPASLRGTFGPVLVADEIDSMEDTVEGDPVELFFKRAESLSNAVKVLASTPTVPGSNIDFYWQLSDKRYWHVPCPVCGHWHTMEWKNVLWPKDTPRDAYLLCPKCDAHLNDNQRREMYYAGEWRPTAPFNGIRGYHLNGIYCPWPAAKGYTSRLHQMAVEHIRAAKKGPAAMRVRVNTFLVENWIDRAEAKPEAAGLMARCENYGGSDYKNPTLPAGVCLLTAAVDVQANRLEAEVVGHGPGAETWGVEKLTFAGNPHNPNTWKPVDDLLDKSYRHENGAVLRVVIMVIDSGDGKTQDAVYKFVQPRQMRRVYAIKGSSVANAPIIATTKESRKRGVHVSLYTVGTDTAKTTVYQWLGVTEKGPRYMHFPVGFGYDEEYFAQLTSESYHTEYRKGQPVRVWTKDRERNEALDIRAYTLAEIEILNPNMAALAALVARQGEQAKLAPIPIKAPEIGKAATTQPVIAPRRSIRLPGRNRRW